jgi:hypothetical protein
MVSIIIAGVLSSIFLVLIDVCKRENKTIDDDEKEVKYDD